MGRTRRVNVSENLLERPAPLVLCLVLWGPESASWSWGPRLSSP